LDFYFLLDDYHLEQAAETGIIGRNFLSCSER